jgi:hypothetical protein
MYKGFPMRKVVQLTSNKFVNLKEVRDPEKGCEGFQFAERRGVDSVSFICYDDNTKMFLLNQDYFPPLDKFVTWAFSGSLDKKIPKIQIVQEEVYEEAGFAVEFDRIYDLGSCIVSTQMNQTCYLYLVDVTGLKQGERHPENKLEAMAKTIWHKKAEVLECQDWKSITILVRAMNKSLV